MFPWAKHFLTNGHVGANLPRTLDIDCTAEEVRVCGDEFPIAVFVDASVVDLVAEGATVTAAIQGVAEGVWTAKCSCIREETLPLAHVRIYRMDFAIRIELLFQF